MSRQKGFIVNLIVLIVSLIIVNYYFGDKIREIIFSDETKQFIESIWGFIVYTWTTYLYYPLNEVWNKVVLGIIWPTLQTIISKIRSL